MKLQKLLGVSLVLVGTCLSGKAQYDGDPTLLGYQYNAMNNIYVTGLYQVPTVGDASDNLWRDSFAYQDDSGSGREMTAGWIRNGKLCGYVAYYPIPSQTYFKYVERDLKTGEVTKEMDVDTSTGWVNYFLNAAYCPADDRIYGYGFNANRTAFAFKSAPASNPNQAVIIREVGSTYPGSISYNQETGAFVGVLNTRQNDIYNNSLVKIDVNTGQTTEIFSIKPGYISDYKCTGGLIWVPSRQAYLWNFYNAGQEEDVCSFLLELKPESRTSSILRGFDGDINYMYFVAENNDPKAVADAPQPITGFQTTIDNRKVKLSFSLPSNLVSGSAISGTISYTIYVDDKSLSTGSAAPGATVSYETTLNDGTHFVRIVPSVSNNRGIGEIYSLFIGTGTPMTPENIVLSESELTWDPVVQGVAGNTLKDVKYQVYVNDKKITDTSDTRLSMNGIVMPDGDLASYQAMIKAVSNGISSKEGYSNRLISGKPWTVPFTVTPTATQYNLMVQEDVDRDGTMWSLDFDQDMNVLTSGFSRADASDDWIYLPKFTADNNKVYTFNFNAYLADFTLPGASVEVWIGDAPEKSAMKSVIIPSIALLSNNRWVEYSGEFVANGDLSGKDLYIGIGVSSEKGILSPLRIYDISVKESATGSINGPEAVKNINVERDSKNLNLAKVTFTMPSKTLSGSTIPASETITAKLNITDVASETVTGKPGETVTASIEAGTINRLISITPSYNGVTGLSKNCVSTLGVGLPGKVTNLRAAYDESNCALRLDWDAPLTDVDGNSMTGVELSYTVWAKNPETGDFEYAVGVPYPLSYATMSMDNITYLYNLEIAITASNSLGESPEIEMILCQVGKPFNLPIEDDFNGDTFKYEPMTFYVGSIYNKAKIEWGNPQSGRWGLSDDMLSVEGDVLCGVPFESGSISRVDLPKVSTLDIDKVTLHLNIWTGANAATTTIKGAYPSSSNTISLNDVKYYPQTVKEIATIPNGSGYQLVNLNLPEEFVDQPWMSLYFESTYPTMSSRFILAGYSLTSYDSVRDVTETLYGTIIGSDGMIKVTGYDGETVYVYGLDGTLVNTAKVVDNVCDVPVNNGMYLVKVANRNAKVVVR